MKPHKFKAIPEQQMMKLFMEAHELMSKYFPDSVADGVAGMTYTLRRLIDACIAEGCFSQDAVNFFAEALTLPPAVASTFCNRLTKRERESRGPS